MERTFQRQVTVWKPFLVSRSAPDISAVALIQFLTFNLTMMTLVAIVLIAFLGRALAECPNACSSHGKCGAFDMVKTFSKSA